MKGVGSKTASKRNIVGFILIFLNLLQNELTQRSLSIKASAMQQISFVTVTTCFYGDGFPCFNYES